MSIESKIGYKLGKLIYNQYKHYHKVELPDWDDLTLEEKVPWYCMTIEVLSWIKNNKEITEEWINKSNDIARQMKER